jgi:hypothetical protein
MVAVREPTALGMNVTLIKQVAAGATGVVQVFFWVKSAAFAPGNAMEPMTSAPEPVFVTVRATGALAVPTNWFAKFRVEGERETAAWVAVPVKDSECGLPAALSEIEIEAERFPAAVGLKITVI